MPFGKRLSMRKIIPGNFAAVIQDFLSSERFEGLEPTTKKSWLRELILAEKHLGRFNVEEMRPALVQGFLDGLESKPGKQKVAHAALVQVGKWGLVRDRLSMPITHGCELIGSDEGHIPWTEEQVELGIRHARRGLDRVIALAVETGQRMSDYTRMTWGDLQEFDGLPGINVRGGQKKTRRSQWVPFTQGFLPILQSWGRRPGHILLRPDGMPWQARSLGSQWAVERNTNPNLEPLREVEWEGMRRPLVLHGLRGTKCARCLLAGATTRQTAEMTGMSEGTVSRYVRFVVQKQQALAAVHHLDRTASERTKLISPKANKKYSIESTS